MANYQIQVNETFLIHTLECLQEMNCTQISLSLENYLGDLFMFRGCCTVCKAQ